MEQLSIHQDQALETLLSDEVVMQWLMDLESEHVSAEEVSESDRAGHH
ncbi:MAG: hypothetical protein V2J10_09500 [Wenzhouxiangella sp.]|jgi:hypothetical protein|nr:hypothetical protein [Wenzhouxiangella sp.]